MASVDVSFRPTFPFIPGQTHLSLSSSPLSLYLNFISPLFADGVGAEIAHELTKRIMIMDGAMGTMLQRRKLEEEDFRGVCMLAISLMSQLY